MTRNLDPLGSYFKIKIEGASPINLVIMLYEGAVNAIDDAIEELNGRNRDQYNQKIIFAQDCVRELKNSLNMEAGGEISKNLFTLYGFVLNMLVEANIARSSPKKYLEHAKHILDGLLDSWKQVQKNESKKEQKDQAPRHITISA